MVATTFSLWTSSPQPRSTTCSNSIDPLSIAAFLLFFVQHKIRRLWLIFMPFCLNADKNKKSADGSFLYKKVRNGQGRIDKLLLYKPGYYAPNGNLSRFG